MSFVDLTWRSEDGLLLHARDYAPTAPVAGVPVICVHGLTRNARDFEDLAPRIAARGRRVFTLDVRYYDTNMSAANCAVYTSSQTAALSPSAVSAVNPGGLTSNWCGSTVVGKLSFDLTLDSLK